MAKSPTTPATDLSTLHAALIHARNTHANTRDVLIQAQEDHARARQSLHEATAALDLTVRQILSAG